jgi:hypothetical protein
MPASFATFLEFLMAALTALLAVLLCMAVVQDRREQKALDMALSKCRARSASPRININ